MMYMLSFLLCVYGLYYWMGWILMMYMLTVYICVLYLSLSSFFFLFCWFYKEREICKSQVLVVNPEFVYGGSLGSLMFPRSCLNPFFGNGVFSSSWLMEKIRKSSKFACNIILWKKMYFGRFPAFSESARLGKS